MGECSECCIESDSRWDEILNNLRCLEKLLRRPTYRERLLAVCIGVSHPDAALFRKWSLSLNSLRWEAIYDFTQSLLLLEAPLRECWSKAAFLSGVAEEVRHVSFEDSDTISTCDRAIRDPDFWLAVGMLHALSFEAEYVGRWAEGCECHEGHHIPSASPCPFKGCRAVEFAAGEWKSKIRSASMRAEQAVSRVGFMMTSCNASTFVADCSLARAKLWSLLETKLHYFQELPWKLCASDWKCLTRLTDMDMVT